MKRKIKLLISFGLILVMMTAINLRVLAIDTATSASSTATVNGYTYTYYSYIQRWNSTLLCARISVMANTTVPIGYIGTKARMYNENGTLVQAADWVYNSEELVGQDTYVYVAAQTNTYYYSKGQVKFYNGNSYTTLSANASPNMSLNGGRCSNGITINEKGEVYGSEIYLDTIGVKADLIRAINERGVEGYVRATDLERDAIEKPADIIWQAYKDREIPLYENDGNTVIGTFTIQNNNSVQVSK